MKCYVLIRVGFDSMENHLGDAVHREVISCAFDKSKLVLPAEHKRKEWDGQTYPRYEVVEAEFIE